MKVIIIFAMLAIGIIGSPAMEKNNMVITDERLVTDMIVNAINDVSQSIKDAGLDPLEITESARYALPVPVIFNAAGEVVELLSTGLSNIVVNDINYGLITRRLTFDIELPLVTFSVVSATADATVFGKTYDASISGTAAIKSIRIRGTVQIGVGIISGISIRSLTINFTLGGIDSNLNLATQDTDYSKDINTFLGIIIPETFTAYRNDINELIRIIMLDYINEYI